MLALLTITTAAARVSHSAPVNQAAISAERPPELLSAYRFFIDIAGREPNAGVTPYDLNTALWSDGALKFRYVFVPPGQQAQYNSDRVFEFPVGTVLIKTFAFAADMRQPTENVRLLETRLLIRRADGWVALPYVWNAEQTEARLSPIGAVVPVSFMDAEGEAISLDWDVPNRNQCKGCHDRNGEITPIGPSARNLNRAGDDVRFTPWGHQGTIPSSDPISTNQLDAWVYGGILTGAPLGRDAPSVPEVFNAASGSIEHRARAYLDVNCAHCHNPEGPAHTSGLDLSWSQTNPVQWGVYKRPVAAGRASAGFAFSIEPGHPERSILVHRMASDDPGVMMPELGRQLVDERAVALMREWIAGMPRDPQAPN